MKDTQIKVSKLPSPIHCGDWHDKPLNWEVTDAGQANVQRFTTKAEAKLFARLWRQSNFIGAMNSYMALPVNYNFRKGHKAQLAAEQNRLCTIRGCGIGYPHKAH